MKKNTAILIFLSLIISIAQVIAENFSEIYIKNDFEYSAPVLSTESGGFILAGGTGAPSDSNATIYYIDNLGDVAWKIIIQQMNVSFFTSIVPINDNKFVAKLEAWDDNKNDFEEYLVIIEEGSIAEMIATDTYYNRLFPANEGFLAYSVDTQDGIGIRTNLFMFDYDLNIIWKESYDKHMQINGIQPVADGFIAYGSAWSNVFIGGFVFKVNKDGSLLWQHTNSVQRTDICDGACVSDGDIVVVGPTKARASIGQLPYCAIANYDSSGLVWSKEYRFEGGVVGRLDSIVEIDDGFIIAGNPNRRRYEVQLIRIDSQGNVLTQWYESTGEIYNPSDISLHRIGSEIYLISQGVLEYDNDNDVKERCVVLKKVQVK